MFKSLRSYYLTAVSDLRFQGIEVLLWRIVVKLCSPLVKLDLQILFDYDLVRPVRVMPSKVPAVISQASQEDIDEILDMQMQLIAPEFADQLTDAEELQYAQLLRVRAKAWDGYARGMLAGERCFIARVNGVLAHSNWLRTHECGPVDGCPVALKPGEIYTTDGFTRESHRGLRLHEFVATSMLAFAHERGCHIAYTITDLTKAGSRRGVLRIGWRRRGTILYAAPRGLKRTWLIRLAGDLEPMFAVARTATADDN